MLNKMSFEFDLIAACYYGNDFKVRDLLRITEPTIDMLLSSCYQGFHKVVAALLEDGRVDPTLKLNKALIDTCCQGHANVLQLLLEDGRINPAARKNQAIIDACYLGHNDILCLLLKDGRADPTCRNNQCIVDASHYNHFEIVNTLIKDGRANPSARINQAMIEASYQGNTDIVRLLMKHSDPSQRNNWALIAASEKGYIDIVRLLLSDEKVDPTVNNIYNSFSPLRVSCVAGNSEVVRCLLEDSRIRNHRLFNYREFLDMINDYKPDGTYNLIVRNLGKQDFDGILKVFDDFFLHPELRAIKALARIIPGDENDNRRHKLFTGSIRRIVLQHFLPPFAKTDEQKEKLLEKYIPRKIFL